MGKIKERVDKYWICEDCAGKKRPKWTLVPYPITVISGFCGHCDREDECTLIPTSDFKRKGHKVEWD